METTPSPEMLAHYRERAALFHRMAATVEEEFPKGCTVAVRFNNVYPALPGRVTTSGVEGGVPYVAIIRLDNGRRQVVMFNEAEITRAES